MHVIIVRVKLKPEHVAAFDAEMKSHVAATRRTEPGCLQFDVATDNADPHVRHLFELYADDKALADHAKSPTLARMRENMKGWVVDRALYNATLWPRPAG